MSHDGRVREIIDRIEVLEALPEQNLARLAPEIVALLSECADLIDRQATTIDEMRQRIGRITRQTNRALRRA